MTKYATIVFVILMTLTFSVNAQKDKIYRKGWIDFNKNGKKDIFEDSTKPIEERIKNLLSLMNLNEKTCQTATLYGYGRVLKDEMPTADWKNQIWKDGIANIDEELNSLPYNKKAVTQYSFPFSKHADAINTVQKWFIEETRMGIPVDFSNEGIHGLCHDRATPFPAPINIGSTWNKELVYRAGHTVGREAKALGYTNIYAPILDVARDPRWGRVVECYAEDPYLIAELGKQMTLGIQSNGIAATLKHYAVYSVPKGGRDGNARTDPHVAPRELHEMFLYPFKRVIQEANPLGIMSSYNDWNGEPVSGSYYFLTELLRKQYGFKGYVVSDSEAVEFISSKHHVANGYKEAVKQAIEAGLNVRTHFTMPENFILPLRELVKEGSVSMKTLDERVADVLRVKFKLGLFDSPYVKDPAMADQKVHTRVDEEMAIQLNRESMVLLKNDKNILPLDAKAHQKILVTGPLATEVNYTTSRYGPSNNPITSILDGIKAYVGKATNVSYSKGCEVIDAKWPESEIIQTPLTKEEQDQIDEAVKAAKNNDIIIAVVGETDAQVGESKSRTSLNLPGRQLLLLQALYATGKPVVMVLVNGRPLTINWENRYLSAILQAGFPGPSAGKVVAETLFGDNNPGGKLTMTYPKSIGQIELNFPYKPGSQAGQSKGEDPNGTGKTRVLGSLYPFGYGLSYTNFEFHNLRLSADKINQKQNITVTVDVKNTGSRKGDQVVQLYLKDVVSSVTTYETVLRGFERVSLTPGETKTVKFILKPTDLAILNKKMQWEVEPGKFEIRIGNSSEDIKLKQEFMVM